MSHFVAVKMVYRTVSLQVSFNITFAFMYTTVAHTNL